MTSLYNPNRFITGLSDASYIVDEPFESTPTIFQRVNIVQVRALIASGPEYWNTETEPSKDPGDQQII